MPLENIQNSSGIFFSFGWLNENVYFFSFMLHKSVKRLYKTLNLLDYAQIFWICEKKQLFLYHKFKNN